MFSVDYRIIAVREREPLVKELIGDAGFDENVVMWDELHNGAVWNSYRVWSGKYSSSHLCILNDDAEIVNGFCGIVNKCVNKFPEAIWTFFSNQFDNDCKGNGTPYIELLGKNTRGICLVIPTKYLSGICAFYDKFLREHSFKEDDRTVGMYAFFNDVPVMTTIPNLVCAKDVDSTFKGYHKTLNSNCWMGKNINIEQFDSCVVEPLLCWSCGFSDTSLPHDSDIQHFLSAKYSALNKKCVKDGIKCIKGGGNYRLENIQKMKKVGVK